MLYNPARSRPPVSPFSRSLPPGPQSSAAERISTPKRLAWVTARLANSAPLNPEGKPRQFPIRELIPAWPPGASIFEHDGTQSFRGANKRRPPDPRAAAHNHEVIELHLRPAGAT